ncbi:GNAT family N-acetyltransferase [Thermospira aquatica]|uniref:GNAT family N-acetyltransferase n=1 Tax=Thermospira aquatica TaxID=2828656 RepID=A0AAX3BBF1_9SPIR|nr:N-acetyltransferase [Thermospira aquatica]URA09658.1 GNAT family N-acetyltransferase [Thermospira aquatica]
MTGFSFYQASLVDEEVITDIERKCFGSADAFPRWQIRRLLTNVYGSVLSEILVFEGEKVGWGCWMTRKKSRIVRLYSLAVLPDFRGKGIAEAYLCTKFREFSKHYRFCHLEVRVSNERALKLYRKLGFVIVKELPGYYGEEDGYRMKLDLHSYMSL